MGYLLVALLALWVGHSWGWNHAHRTVALECERLGKFYVGKTVYHCTQVETPTP